MIVEDVAVAERVFEALGFPAQRESWGGRLPGFGSWTIRIGVNDVAAKAEDLRRRGTKWKARTRSDGNDAGPHDWPD